MDWRSKVELFEEIRREYEFGVGTIAGVSKKFGVHRRMVREAVGSAIPQLRKKTKRRRFKLAPVAGFIDQILESDRKAPRKQRALSHRSDVILIRCQPAPIADTGFRKKSFPNACGCTSTSL